MRVAGVSEFLSFIRHSGNGVDAAVLHVAGVPGEYWLWSERVGALGLKRDGGRREFVTFDAIVRLVSKWSFECGRVVELSYMCVGRAAREVGGAGVIQGVDAEGCSE